MLLQAGSSWIYSAPSEAWAGLGPLGDTPAAAPGPHCHLLSPPRVQGPGYLGGSSALVGDSAGGRGQSQFPSGTSTQILGAQLREPPPPPKWCLHPCSAAGRPQPRSSSLRCCSSPKAGASPPRSLFDTFLEAVFCSGFVFFFPLNKFLPVFNETHGASSPSALLGGSGGFGDVRCREGRRWDCRGLSLPCRVSAAPRVPPNPSWGSGRVFRAVSWSKRGSKVTHRASRCCRSPKPASPFHQMPRGGWICPTLELRHPTRCRTVPTRVCRAVTLRAGDKHTRAA